MLAFFVSTQALNMLQRSLLFFCLFGLLAFSTALADERLAEGDRIQVKVRKTAIRAEPKAWSSTVKIVSYGDYLNVLALGGGWVKVKAGQSGQGYVHSSAVTTKKVVLSLKGVSDSEADPSDIVMAGKGFSKKVEEAYAVSHPSANLRAVDAMERWNVKASVLAGFMRDGKLGESVKN